MIVFRIGTDTPHYKAEDTAGTGAKITGGRWNSVGQAVIYAAESRAIAALETLVHIDTSGMPLNRYLVELDIPEAIWSARQAVDAAEAIGWDAIPAGQVSIELGDRWLLGRESLVLQVPSVVVPEEAVVLLNPAHPDIAHVGVRKVRKWLYDPRLFAR